MQLIDVEELKKVLELEPLNIKPAGSIDRKTVIDFLSGIANLDPRVKGSLVIYVMSLPDIQPERKTGKWILKDDNRYHCSSCDGIAPKGYRWSFCPECGADMREANNADKNQI